MIHEGFSLNEGVVDRDQHIRFFDRLAPRLQAARSIEHVLDRELARRFNVLDYLRTDELGLSRIIADLLNPAGPHGQGALYLRSFLHAARTVAEYGGTESTRFAEAIGDFDDEDVRVILERRIKDDRRIDISVEIKPRGKEPSCLAIENKPYAADQQDQVKDYLNYLKNRYEYRTFLIYLSRNGDPPSEVSIKASELPRWERQFATMAYCGAAEPSSDTVRQVSRTVDSLADWLDVCRRESNADRLRGFLGDATRYVRQQFGGVATSDREVQEVVDYVLESEENVRTANAVHDAWPKLRDGICRGFLGVLKAGVKDLAKECDDDLIVDFNYCRERRWVTGLWVYRESWPKYGKRWNKWPNSYCIALEGDRGANNLFIGVRAPDPGDAWEAQRRDVNNRLCSKIERARESAHWPWYKHLEEYANWDHIVAVLYAESKSKSGKALDYLLEQFRCLIGPAVEAINEVEGVGGGRTPSESG